MGKMERAEIPELERRLIINLYWNQKAKIMVGKENSREFRIERGVRQGCIISPILFNLYSEYMIQEALGKLEGISVNGVNINNIRYADDAVLIADSLKKLQKMIDSVNEACKAYAMAINVKKTKVMVISQKGNAQCKVLLNQVELEQVKRYKYLGSWISEDLKCGEELISRIEMAKAASWKNEELLRKNFSTQTKLMIINCYIFSVLNYGAECWTWNREMKKRVDAFEMWYYRRMLKISWKEKVSNIEVLKRVDTKLHFGIDMWKRKLSFTRHVLRGSGTWRQPPTGVGR